MSGKASNPSISLRERKIDSDGGQEKLPKWLGLSFLLHGIFIIGLFLMPYWPTRTIVPPPIYTVDLVGGERIGGSNLGTELLATPKAKPKPPPAVLERPSPPPEPKKEAKVEPPPPPPEPKKKEVKVEPPPPPAKPKKEVKVEPPPPPPEVKKPAKKEVVEKPANTQKEKAEEKTPAAEKILVNKEVTKKEVAKKEAASAVAKDTVAGADADEASLEQVRERLIQSAVERVRNRTETTQKTSNKSKEEPISAGTGEGIGSASLGTAGPGGGGVVKGIEFIAYQNQMLRTIKANWAWVGANSNLRVVVHFFIRESGDIVGLKIVQPSGDPSYDESVLRAVSKSSPLPPPPESYRKEFSEIRITFRPRDLGA